MQFTSMGFLCFAALLLVVYYVVPKSIRWVVLLTASYIFYIFAGLEYLFFILFTTVTTYIAARIIDLRLKKQKLYISEHKDDLSREDKKALKEKVKRKNQVILVIYLVLNFGILAVCKGLLIAPFNALASGTPLGFLSLGLPLGISFYMFQSVGYVVDIHRGAVSAERNFFKTALFVSFFPQLVQGPISKFSQLAPQLFEGHDFSGRNITMGLWRVLWGFFKKLVIADRIAVAVVTLKGTEFDGMGFLLLATFYAVQIYGDFTGGIDVAVGLAEMFGIKMTENFVRPFFSKNIAEYWRRWHISLGEWMKDYIFYPLSVCKPMRELSKVTHKKMGNLGKRIPVYIASVITWFATGIWHGFSPNFIVWGMLNCFFIVLSEELVPLYGKFHNRFGLKEKKLYGLFEMVRMFTLMNLIRISDLFPDVSVYFAKLGSLIINPNISLLWNGKLMELGLSGLDYGILCFGIVIMLTVSIIGEFKGNVREVLAKQNIVLRYAVIFALFLVVLLAGSYGIGYNASNFIYNQF
jgi:D-alanyl-lipoteichoic acid acyltransferase DltB (MBOAT superfamily)